MKRLNNLYEQICSMDNLRLADKKASKNKARQPGVIAHRANAEADLLELRDMIMNKTYKTSEYITFPVYEPKERLVYRLPYFPDRIAYHAIMNVLEPVFVSMFTADTYSCIKGRGIHKACNKLKQALKDVEGTTYCLKLDVTKFYPSVDHAILKMMLRRKFKDQNLLTLLDEIIDSAPGLPIGNYLSQYLANFYLSYFDHWIKEDRKVKYYFRYADDMVILSDSKKYLHALLQDIRAYLECRLHLIVKRNCQVFPVDDRGIDVLGYVFYHTHVLLRKRIKQRFARAVHRGSNKATIAAYMGWAKHCDSKHLIKKILKK